MFKNLSIKVKLSLLSVLTLALLAYSISYVAIEKSSKALLEDKFAQLSTIEVAKHAELKNYFNGLEDLLTSLASSEATKDIFNGFQNGFEHINEEVYLMDIDITEKLKLEYKSNYLGMINYDIPNAETKTDLNQYIPQKLNARLAQYIFIANNPTPVGQKNSFSYDSSFSGLYMQTHKKYHSVFNKYLKSFDLYDIFLINNDADIIYTVFKEKDFGTNLNKDRYKNSGLARVYKKALSLREGQIAFEDFTPYEPSYNVPAAFVATPIYKNNKRVGVLAFQLPVSHLNNIMQFNQQYDRAGLGKTGEAYLVGSDYLMRTNSRFYKSIDDNIVQKLESTVGVWEVKTKSTQAVVNGDSHIGKWIVKDYRGKDVLSIYHTVDVFNTTKWAIVAEIDYEEAIKASNELKTSLLYITGVLLFIFLFIKIFLISTIVFKPLNKFQNKLIHFFEFLKKERDDVKILEIEANDEIGKMSTFVNDGIVEVKKAFSKRDQDEWIKDGISKFNTLLIDNTSFDAISSNGLKFICEYLKTNVGVLYIFKSEDNLLLQQSFYSYTKTNATKSSYSLGDGIVGQVGLQQEPIVLTDGIKENTDMLIQSAIRELKPKATYTYPLVYQGELFGVVEIGSITLLDEKAQEFLNAISKAFAIALSSAEKNKKVAELLDKTKKSNQQLKIQQQQLEEANVSMEEQQQQLEVANTSLEEQQQQLEEANALMEEQQQQLEVQNHDLQKAKEEVVKKADDLALSSKYKSEFLANMSHELRTPLNAIILLSQLLTKNKQENLNEDDVKKAQTIYTSGNELLRLINDVLDLSKVEAGKIEIIVDEFSPKELLENIQNLYSFSASEKGVELNIVDNYKDSISSDKNRISQILKNLVSNALKFTDKGSITIEVNKTNDLEKPIEISVIDTGIGIPAEKQQLIFEAFTQADGSTSRKYGGTGLGLSITKELTHLLKGEITLESSENKGSKFTITIPNLDKESYENEIIQEEIKELSPKVEPTLFKIDDDKNIIGGESGLLVIDDDISFSKIVYENIKKSGHYGIVANNGKDALNILQDYNISGIMLDLTLPDMDGVDILKKIKADKKLQDIPVYIISSKDKDEKLLQMGAKGYGQKPLLEDDIEEIITTLDKFIKDHKAIKNESLTKRVILDEIDLSDISVLVVDDDIKNIFVLDNVLNESNAKVFTAYNGKEAIEQLKANKEIDIVLMDIMMPVMDGYEAIKVIRADDELKNIPIIAVTAKAMKEDRDKCISLGADDFVSKPIDMDALISLVKVWSDKKHQ